MKQLRVVLMIFALMIGFCSNANGQALKFSLRGALESSTNLNVQDFTPMLEQAMPERPSALELLFGGLQTGHVGQAISFRLIAWSLPWIAVGTAGLWTSKNRYAQGFWGMNAAWGVINVSIAYAGLLGTESSLSDLRTILLINAGLDLVYVLGGLYLSVRSEEVWRGAGASVIVQGVFLLAFDLLHAALMPIS